jgi:CTP-dependent riboflavin kinase
VAGYPSDQVESSARFTLREELGLVDGDTIAVRVNR